MTEPQGQVVRMSPDGTLVAIRRGPDDWRVSNGGHYRDQHVVDWTPLGPTGPMMSGRVPDLLRYASENARSVQQMHQDDPSGVPISAIALANVMEQLVLAITTPVEFQRPDPAAAVARVEALAEEWEAAGDARYSQNRIAKETAARSLRAALRPADVTGGQR